MSELRFVFSAQLEPFFAALSNSSSWWHNWGIMRRKLGHLISCSRCLQPLCAVLQFSEKCYIVQIETLYILQLLPSLHGCTLHRCTAEHAIYCSAKWNAVFSPMFQCVEALKTLCVQCCNELWRNLVWNVTLCNSGNCTLRAGNEVWLSDGADGALLTDHFGLLAQPIPVTRVSNGYGEM